MTGQGVTVLRRYRYDPVDRVVGCVSPNQESAQLFYRSDRLATEIQGQEQYSFFEHASQVLAQQQREAGKVECALQATDLQGSVLHAVAVGQHQQMVYSAYGHRSSESGLISLLGFNGERRDPVTGHYLLGIGYRAFNPVLGRLNSPDSLSPFRSGGLNAYAYCLGDPVNLTDSNGHTPFKTLFSAGRTLGGRVSKPMRNTTTSRTARALGKREAASKLRSDYAKDQLGTKLSDGPIEDLIRPGKLGEIQQEIFNIDRRMLRDARGKYSAAYENLELKRAPILSDEKLSKAFSLMRSKGFPESELPQQQPFELFSKSNPEMAQEYSQAVLRTQAAKERLNFAQNNYLMKYPTPMHQPLSRRVESVRR